MYWYIKYPLIVITVLALLGLVCLVWRSCVSSIPRPPQVEGTEGTNTPQPPPPADPASSGKNTTPTPQPSNPASGPSGSSRGVVPELEDKLAKARIQMKQGQLEAARRIAALVLKDSRIREFDRTWYKAADIINDVNKTFMNGTAPCSEKKRYMVVKGDTLQKIATRNLTSVEFLLRMNPAFKRESGDPVIHPSDTIFYMSPEWSIRVSKHHYVLLLYNGDDLYRYYHVGIGRENRTPVGTFVISERQEHPSWTPPGKNIPYGDPENILGTHWLRLTPVGDTDPALTGYGIHGTWDDDSIGKAASSGCIRLQNEEVHELYDIIPTPGRSVPLVYVTIEE